MYVRTLTYMRFDALGGNRTPVDVEVSIIRATKTYELGMIFLIDTLSAQRIAEAIGHPMSYPNPNSWGLESDEHVLAVGTRNHDIHAEIMAAS